MHMGHMANPLISLHCHIDIITRAFLFVTNSMTYFISAKFFECALFVPHSYSIIQPSRNKANHRRQALAAGHKVQAETTTDRANRARVHAIETRPTDRPIKFGVGYKAW